MKAIIYARVSTEMQEEGRSLEFQIKKCEDYCTLNNFKIKKVIQDVESGGNDNREGFLKLQDEIKKKSFDVLVVYESSRISRITLTMLNFVLELQKSDIKFVSISQSEINTTTPTGMLFFQIFAVLADYERKQISMRVKSNKWARAKAGIWQGGNLPLGYRKGINNEIELDPETVPDVVNIFETYIRTGSISRTADLFGKSTESIRWILKNEFYIGNLVYGRKENNINTGITKINKNPLVFKGNHPALIDDELFESVQNQLLFKQRVIKTENKFLFTGILECRCGGRMFKNGNNYRCEKCRKAISKNKAENFIINKLLNLKELEFLNEKPDLEKYISEKKNIEKLIQKIEIERTKYLELFSKELITESELIEKLDELKSRKSFFAKSITEIENVIKDKTVTEKELDNIKILKEVLENMEDSDRIDLFEMFRLLIEKIKIKQFNPLRIIIFLRK